jgi:anaerobic ribonucleoside-triphosphate reductase
MDAPSIDTLIDPIIRELCLEKEKQKCLKDLQSYYQKYGCEEIDKLRAYLTQCLEQTEDTEIQKQLDLLEEYA